MVDLCREIVNVVGEHESDNPDSGGKTGSHRESAGIYRDFLFKSLQLTLAGSMICQLNQVYQKQG